MAILIVKPILSNPTIDSWIKLILTLNHALVIYPNSAGVLFLSLAWVTAKCLQVFSERIEEKANQVGVGRQTVLINIQKNDEDERMVDNGRIHFLLMDFFGIMLAAYVSHRIKEEVIHNISM